MELGERFRRFARREARGRSPLYEVVAEGVADEAEVLELLAAAPPSQQRPNLLLAAVHDLVLRGTDHLLASYYPSAGGQRPPDRGAVDAFVAFCRESQAHLLELITTRNTQTNEVRRGAALAPGWRLVAHREDGAPLSLVEVGASAGLNLLHDRYAFDLGSDVRGTPPTGPLLVGARVGIDIAPLHPVESDDARWLRACVWPEHLDRLALLDQALAVAAQDPPSVVPGDLVDALPEVVAKCPDPVVVFHSATLAYLSGERIADFVATLADLSQHRRLWWLSLEGPFIPPFDTLVPPSDTVVFALGLTHWDGDDRRDELLATADPHGTWVHWM